jgi:hypothetical protein
MLGAAYASTNTLPVGCVATQRFAALIAGTDVVSSPIFTVRMKVSTT